MTDYRKILMLRSKGCSQCEMERSKVASREKTKEVYEAADKLGLSWPLDDDITNADLEEILFSGKYKSGCRYVEPDYPYIHQELAKPGLCHFDKQAHGPHRVNGYVKYMAQPYGQTRATIPLRKEAQGVEYRHNWRH